MRVLVTGSNGFIGSHLAMSLHDHGHDVCGFDSFAGKGPSILSRSVMGDIRDTEATDKALKSVEAVIHLVAAHRDFGVSVSEYNDINVNGTQNLLSGCSKYGIHKFVFYSSVAVYGSQPKPTTETTTPCPDGPYGRSKLAAEKIVVEWVNAASNRQVAIIRPTLIFGPENYANMYNLIDKICRKKFVFVGSGSNIKSVAYVENLAAATLFCLSNLKNGVAIYNYVDEPQMTTRQMVERIAEYAGVAVPRLTIPLSVAMAGTYVFDILGRVTGHDFSITAARIKKFCTSTHHMAEKIRKDGFKQPVSLEDGFRQTVEWYLEQKKWL